MKVLKFLKDKMLIITPNDIKMQILKSIGEKDKNYDIKFMDFDNLKRHIYFDYDLNAVSYLMDTYQYKIDVCKVYLDNMYYLEEKNYTSFKLKELLKLKKELYDKHLLKTDPYFKYYINQVEVLVYGYDKMDRFMKYTLSLLEKITRVTVVDEKVEERATVCYEFSTIEEEVDFVLCSILKLVHSGEKLSNIKLVNVGEEYYDTIRRLSLYYNLPVRIDSYIVYSTPYIQTFLEQFKSTKDLETSYNYMIDNYEENELSEILLSICNQVVSLECSFNTKLEILISLLKDAKLKQKKSDNEIEVIDNLSHSLKEEHIFLMGVNQNIFPKLYKDEDYISDNLKDEVYLSTTREKNKLEKDFNKKLIWKIPNITLTYKLKTPSLEYYPSSLLEEIGASIVRDYKSNEVFSYSHLANKIKLAKALDRFRKYHEKEDYLDILYANYKDIPYLTYQNQFTGLDKNSYLDFINHKLLLSFTSLNQYELCNFRYYLNYVLKLKPYEETFATYIGNLYHKLLSLAFLSNFDFDKEFDLYKQTRELTVKEVFLLKKLKKSLIEVIEILKKQKELTNFKNELYEKEIFIQIPNQIKVLFKGTIDKIMYQERENETLVSLIDYKSGTVKTDINNMIYGIDMQLPVYLYLVKRSNLFTNFKFGGFYFQKILHGEIIKKENVSLDKQKQDRMKLIGYSTSSENLLEEFDSTYQNSELIHGMRLTSKGFSSYSKILSDDDIEKILILTEEKIKEAASDIVSAKFMINPKKIGKENISCTYCPFLDICHRKEEDIVMLKEYKDLSFLDERGDDNG